MRISAPSRILQTFLAAAIGLAVPFGARATPASLEISTNPPLPIAASVEGSELLSAASGVSLQLNVIALDASGNSNDVTTAGGTTYQSLTPSVVQVSNTGVLSFSASAGESRSRAAAIVITHAGLTKLVGFDVTP